MCERLPFPGGVVVSGATCRCLLTAGRVAQHCARALATTVLAKGRALGYDSAIRQTTFLNSLRLPADVEALRASVKLP